MAITARRNLRRLIPGLIPVLLSMPLLPMTAQANDIEPSKEFYTAIKATNPIVVDGDLSDWAGANILADPRFSIPKGSGDDGELVNFELHNGGNWTGPDDHTSNVRVVYDDENVYFGFVVTDEYHENAANSAWNGDSVQLMVANDGRDTIVGLYNYALGGTEENLADTEETIIQHERGAARDNPDYATFARIIRDTENKRTTYEIRLPKGALAIESLEGGVQFGLGMAINDGDEDTPGQRGWGGLGAHSIVFGKSPEETALVTLAAPPVERERIQGNDIEPGKEFYTAIKAVENIVVDGDLGEWGAAQLLADPRFSIPKGSKAEGELVNFELHNGGNWNGPDDQTSNVRVVYDDENIYFGFIVTDEYHENGANSAWNGDSVQLMVANDARDTIVGLYNYALGGVEGNLGGVIVQHERGAANDNPDYATSAVITRDVENKRTIYEIKLPKGAVGLDEIKGGVQFGLGMAINDGDEDTPGQRGWGGLGAHSIVFGKSPEETARVTLATANDIEPGKEFYSADFPPGEIALDGELDDWEGVPVLADPRFAIPKGSTSRGEGELVLFELHNGGSWDGPDDHTSAVRIAYDPENVYFAFVVTDEYHENGANSAWNGDSVQLMIANDKQDAIVGLYNYALGGIETALGAVIVQHERGAANDNPDFATSAVITRNTETKRTTYEIKLPKGALGLETLEPGSQFGLGMAINDGDEATPGQRGWGGLGAHSIVFGKSPEQTALVTLGVIGSGGADPCFASAVNSPTDFTPEIFTFRGNNFENCRHDPQATVLLINGQPVESLAFTPASLGATDYTYTFPDPFPGGSEHTWAIKLYDFDGREVFSDRGAWTAPDFAILTADMQVRRVDTTKPGFIWRVFQNETHLPANLVDTEAALAGEFFDPAGEPVSDNFADESLVGAADGPGVFVGAAELVEFEIPGVINLNASEGGESGNFSADQRMPGVPGVNDSANGTSAEIITYVDFPAGNFILGVNSDDGFRMEGGQLDNPVTMGDFPRPRSAFDSRFRVEVVDAGIYPIRVIYYNRGGGASIELFHETEDGTKILLNDIANGGLPAYRSAPEEFLITAIDRDDQGVSLTWQSKAGRYYAVETSIDLIEWQTIVTEIPEGGAAGDSVSYTDSGVPADTPALYYRVRQVPAPAHLSTDFEDGAEGWEAFTDAGDTTFELGTPNVEGLTEASSGVNAWGTNLAGNYTPGVTARLRSPVVDVTGDNSPKLSFNYYNDTTLDVEGTVIQFLDENGEILASFNEPDQIFTGQTEGWVPFSVRFPGVARERKVIVQFLFLTDEDDEVGAGFYIDDVRID